MKIDMKFRRPTTENIKPKTRDVLLVPEAEASALELCGIDAETKEKLFLSFESIGDGRDQRNISLLTEHAANLLLLIPQEVERIHSAITPEEIIEILKINPRTHYWYKAANGLKSLYPAEYVKSIDLIGSGMQKGPLMFVETDPEKSPFSSRREKIEIFRFTQNFRGETEASPERVAAIFDSAEEYIRNMFWKDFLDVGLEATYYAPEMRDGLRNLFLAKRELIAAGIREERKLLTPGTFGGITVARHAAAFAVLDAEEVEVEDHARIKILTKIRPEKKTELPQRAAY